MNSITGAMALKPAPIPERPDGRVSLQERMQAAGWVPETGDGEEEDVVLTPASAWAQQLFKEMIFFGDEETNGIPPLTMDP